MHVQCDFTMHFDNLKLLLRLLATCMVHISVFTLISTISIFYICVHVGCPNLVLRFSYIISGVGNCLGMGKGGGGGGGGGGWIRGHVVADTVSA